MEHDPIALAVEHAAQHGAPAKTFDVGPDARVEFGTGPHPYDGLTLTHWTD